MKVAEMPISFDRSALAGFCAARGIRRLSLFGSAVRPDFNPDTSDLDVFAEFQPGALQKAGLDYFDYGPELSRLLGRRVDFCSRLNPHIFPLVQREMVTLYEQS